MMALILTIYVVIKTSITKIGKDGGYSDVDNDGHDNTVVAGMMIMTMILIMMMVMMIMIVTMKGKVIENR